MSNTSENKKNDKLTILYEQCFKGKFNGFHDDIESMEMGNCFLYSCCSGNLTTVKCIYNIINCCFHVHNYLLVGIIWAKCLERGSRSESIPTEWSGYADIHKFLIKKIAKYYVEPSYLKDNTIEDIDIWKRYIKMNERVKSIILSNSIPSIDVLRHPNGFEPVKLHKEMIGYGLDDDESDSESDSESDDPFLMIVYFDYMGLDEY